MTISLAILGPPLLRVDGQAVRVPAGRQSRTLLHLAIRRDQVVSQDRLVDMLWADDPPKDPDNAVQYVIARLRRLLEPSRGRGDPPEVLQRVGEGYRLRLPVQAIDAAVLDQTVASGTQDAATYREAIDSWRGRPFLDHPDDPVLQSESARLTQLYTRALGRWAELALEDEQVDRVAEEVGAALAPGGPGGLDEALHRPLMIALYRQGRQTEALAVYDRLQERLVEELGLDPSPALATIRDAILRHDVAVLEPRAVGRPSAPRTGRASARPAAPVDTFVGRETELAGLSEAVDRARLVTLTGPSGVGKTRLAQEFGWQRHAGAIPGEHDPTDPAVVIWVSLDPVRDPQLVLPAVADAAGLRENLQRPAVDVLAEQLGAAVLILDNAEHVLTGVADLLGGLLARQPELRAVVTSQARLGIRGEQVLTLDPLEPPSAADQSWASTAVQLFCDRAAAIDGTFEVDDATVEHVSSIVTSVDGLPLAIELAAASARTVGVAELAARVA